MPINNGGKMSKLLRKWTVLTVLIAGLSLVVFAADISGTWAMTISTPNGEMETEMTIEQDGDTIKVTMEGFQGEELTGEGTFKENKAEWSVTASTPNGDFTIDYTGILEDEILSGKVMSDFGEAEWTAKKK
jgi:hypothetical protein